MSVSSKWGPMIEATHLDDPGVAELLCGDAEDRSVWAVLIELRVYSMAAGSNGRIPGKVLRRATLHPDPVRAMERLESVKLAERDGDDWLIDWSNQKTAEEIEEQRVKGAAYKRHQRGDHKDCATWGFKGCPKDVRPDVREDVREESAPKPKLTQPNRTEPNRTEGVGVGDGEGIGAGAEEIPAPLAAGEVAPGALPPSLESPNSKSEQAGEPVARAPRSVIV